MVSLLLSEPIGIMPPRVFPVFGRWTSRARLC
ncbi:hypothetical protein LINGRAHAP2_LOCUS98 [Linum grandiflorum]